MTLQTGNKLDITYQQGHREPLHRNRDALRNYIVIRVMTNEIYGDDDRIRQCVNKLLRVGASVGIACARVGVVFICIKGSSAILDKPKDDASTLGMAIPNIIGSTISFGIVSVYSTFELIDAVLHPLSEEELELITIQDGCAKQTAIKVGSVSAGLLVQVPFAYATYLSAPFAPGFFAASQFLDFGRAAYSTHMTLTELGKKEKINPLDHYKYLLEIRQGFAKQIAKTQLAFQFNTEQRRAFLDLLQGLEGQMEKDCAAYVRELFNFATQGLPKGCKPPLSSAGDKAVLVGTVVMAAGVLAELWQLAGMGTEALTGESNIMPWIGSIVVTAANAHIWYKLIRKSTTYAVNLLRGANPPSITEPINPTFYSRFTKIGTACATMTWVGSVYFAKLAFGSISKVAYYTVASVASVGSTLGAVGAVHLLRDKIIRSRASSDADILLLKVDKKLQKFAELISQIPVEKLSDFLAQLPDELQQRFLAFSPTLSTNNIEKEAFLRAIREV